MKRIIFVAAVMLFTGSAYAAPEAVAVCCEALACCIEGADCCP